MTWLFLGLLLMVGLTGLTELGLRALQLASALKGLDPRPVRAADGHDTEATPFVSVHVPTCNEPPALVIATLEHLAASRFENFEVIVVDNNTEDPNVWSPVAAATDRFGPRFRFVHIDRLTGAKAGALNLALAASDARTTHVAVVDADYQVDPDFLDDAVRTLASSRVDYVQFPQAYRGVGCIAQGVEHELGDYFACFAGGSGRAGSMLPTGTLSLFDVRALRAVGGWPTETITEDAEIGVRLQAAGYRGLWLARSRGRGLLPIDLAGIQKQRARWAAGNLQVLKRLHRFQWLRLSLGDLLNLIVQLTSWTSFILPAAIGLVLAALAPGAPLAGALAALSGAIIVFSAGLTGVRLLLVHADRVSLRVRLEAFATKTALTWTSATAWMPALLPRPLEFHRTLKSVGGRGRRGQGATLALSGLFLVLGAEYTLGQHALEALACLFLGSVWLCGCFVDASLRRAAALNPEFG